MTTLTQATTEGQIEQTTRVVVDAVRKALKPIGKEAAQRVHARGHELAAGISKLIAELSVTDRYADEQVETDYPANYEVKPLAEQIKTVAKLFGLDTTKALAYAEKLEKDQTALPEGAEGWFAIPRFQVFGTYEQAVNCVLVCVGENRRFKNWLEGQVGARYLRQSERTKEMMQTLLEKQQSDILIVPAQFGFRHRGKSVRRARETFNENEFGLGAFAVGCMLLTHPEREQEWEQLRIDCSGDEYSPVADGKFGYAPIFGWGDGELRFGIYWAGSDLKPYGSASGFLPQE